MMFDVRRLDIYRKIPKDLTQPTYTGAAISICSIFFILFLLISEFYGFITVEVTSVLFVDMPSGVDKIDVRLNVTLPNMKCEYLGLDIQDEMGRHEVGFHENVQKIDLFNGAACRFEGWFKVNKVPGNFHLSTHGASSQPDAPDMTHVINSLQFGEEMKGDLPGAYKALSEHVKTEANALSSHDYIIKIVPTLYQDLSGVITNSYQYTVAYKDYLAYGHGHRVLPAIWFRYELSPITVKHEEKRKPLYHFITTICAIVGGTFTVAGIIDSMIFTASEVFKKMEIGKLS